MFSQGDGFSPIPLQNRAARTTNGGMSNILHNATVDTLLERRSIRKFKPKPLPDDVVETLETVAQHAASSQFLNDWSAIRVTEPAAKKRLAEIGG